ncbi:MAG: cytochrome-c peroxidase [Anaerolineae bacterium]
MSNQKNKPKESWGNRSMSKIDWGIVGGFMIIAFALTAGLILYTINNQPEREDVVEGETAVSDTTTAAEEVVIVIPPLAPLPDVSFPLDNPYTPQKAELGMMLYFDTRFSGDGSLSCNSCHPASDGSWAVGSQVSFGYPGSSHWRNAQSIINIAYFSKLNWDGGKTSIEKQNHGAWSGAVAGNVDSGMAEERLAQIPEYVERFQEVFGTQYPLYIDALRAVSTFERTIVSQNVPFDAFLMGDDSAISDEAKAGYELFTGKANCLACHNGPLISDDSFHNIGVPTYAGFTDNAINQITFRYEQWAKGVTEEDYNTATEDMGLYYVTKLHDDIGKFRTPGLRDACYTAPYMHNGAFATFDEVVTFYNNGGGSHENKDPLIQPLNLTVAEQAALVAFLNSLCGDKITFEAPDLPAYEPWDMETAVIPGEQQ